MGSANVDLVQAIYAAWERGDYGSAHWADPGIEFVFADGPSPSRSIGLAAMAEANRDWLEAWDDVRQVMEDIRELDDNRVLALHCFVARGKKSGLELDQIQRRAAAVYTIENGKVISLVHYFDRDRGLADLGLGSPGDSPST